MKARLSRFAFLGVLGMFLTGRASALDPDMARFAAEKEAQVREQAETLTNKVPSLVWDFFSAVRVDDWNTATNLAAQLSQASGRYQQAETNSLTPALHTLIWPPISETLGAYDQFHDMDGKWLRRFGREIIDSIPRGGIYFGGTDPGRFVISALVESQQEGRPFFVFTQNQLADSNYLEYLREIYGRKLKIPTPEDSQKAFTDYMADAQQRMQAGKLKPGENIHVVDGRLSVSGSTAVMEINALLAKDIVNQNPGREYYIEESFPLDWMYPHLSPHGLIFQLQPDTTPDLNDQVIQKDHDYWQELTGEMVGGWLTDRTSVQDVCDFAGKVYGQKNLAGFKGDPGFARSAETQKCFSKLRSSIAGLYVWRMDHSQDRDEKARLRKAADLAFRQSIAFYPCSPEAIFRYTAFLNSLQRQDDAVQIAETAARLADDASPYKTQFRNLVRQLRATD